MSEPIQITEWDDVAQGDFVKVRVGNERVWFQVLARSETEGQCNSLICRLDTSPAEAGIVFDGRVTIDRDWVTEAVRKAPPHLKLVG